MSHIIAQIGEYYYIWSTVTDSFYTSGLSREELKEYCLNIERNSLEEFNKRMERVDKYGTSWANRPTKLICYFESIKEKEGGA